MIVSILDFQPASERRTEVLQTLASLAHMIREEQGCLRCSLCQQCGGDDAFTIIEEWRNREEFDEHLRSRIYSILLGLKPLLRKPMEVSICAIAARERMEAVRRARGHARAHGA